MRAAELALAGVLLILLTLTGTAHAYPRDDAAVVEVEILSRTDIHRLNELHMDIMSVADGKAQIAAVPEEVETLWANGFRPAVIVENMMASVASLRVTDRGEYHSYSELTADMTAWAAAYPGITELVSIGESVYGRELWAMKITDNPTVEEFEAEIQWIGAHHGDETISSEVCYYMIEYLLENYGTDPQVTWLVNEREIWILPMFNPDGFESGSRYNGNGTDLNRNYLCPCGCNAGSSFSEPETQALRAFDIGRNPVTSLTFHSGAIYVNYLWDYTYSPTPDEPMIITLSDVYGALSGYPVTNGADWYIVHGSCQDWCYDTRGEIDTTIEVSVTKDPPASQIDPIFNDNRDAMLHQARMSGRGIRGLVTDGDTGDPIYATISIPEIGKDVYTDPDVGDYHRMVESGTYTVVCSADEYPTQTVYNVSASLDTFVVVNFALEPPPRGTIAGYVRDES
ncbi:succinylglutamate desuccinylase/aspartoacylase family protein, partial [bacterium]|nr:succinylglutamate desuccinylase/aspartoacylase family protein [bacterium]